VAGIFVDEEKFSIREVFFLQKLKPILSTLLGDGKKKDGRVHLKALMEI
jgi:hypothetical protein